MTGRTVCFRLDEDQVDLYEAWTECAAFRFVRLGDDEVRLETTNDLELITRPGAE